MIPLKDLELKELYISCPRKHPTNKWKFIRYNEDNGIEIDRIHTYDIRMLNDFDAYKLLKIKQCCSCKFSLKLIANKCDKSYEIFN